MQHYYLNVDAMTQPIQVREEGLLVPDTEGTKVTPAASSREIRDLPQTGLSLARLDR